MLAEEHLGMLILREKDLDVITYIELAKQVMEVCADNNVEFVISSCIPALKALHKAEAIQLSIQQLCDNQCLGRYYKVGCSVHSAEEAAEAESLGASYLIAGHIFATDCKKDIPPRGLDFLREVVSAVKIPVYAIGGINRENCRNVLECGAAGYCMMSELMRKRFSEV